MKRQTVKFMRSEDERQYMRNKGFPWDQMRCTAIISMRFSILWKGNLQVWWKTAPII